LRINLTLHSVNQVLSPQAGLEVGCLEVVPAPLGAECLGTHQLKQGHLYLDLLTILVVFLAAATATTTNLQDLVVLVLPLLLGVFSDLSHLPHQGACSEVTITALVEVCLDPRPIPTHPVGAYLDHQILVVVEGFLDLVRKQVVACLGLQLIRTPAAICLGQAIVLTAVQVEDCLGAATTIPVGVAKIIPVEGCLEAAITVVEVFLEVPTTAALIAVYSVTVTQVAGCSETTVTNPLVFLVVQIIVVEAYLEILITVEGFSAATTNRQALLEIRRQTTTIRILVS